MAEIALVPRLTKNCSLDGFKFWRTEFLAFVDIIVAESDMNTIGLKYLKYAIASACLELTFDSKTTFKSALEKVEMVFVSANRPANPLSDFMAFSWNSNITIQCFIGKLISLLFFIDNKAAQDQLIKQRILEMQSYELRIVLSKESLPSIVTHLETIPRQTVELFQIASISQSAVSSRRKICFNCGLAGHIKTKCFKPRVVFGKGSKSGHLTQFCQIQKNYVKAVLSEDQSGLNDVQSSE